MNTAQRALRSIWHSGSSGRTLRNAAVASRGTTPLMWLAGAMGVALMIALPPKAGARLRGKKVKDVMVESVTAIDASAPLIEAAETMRQANVGVLPVVENGRVRGVITDRDLVIRAMARGSDPRSTRVAECQTSNVICARPEWRLQEAMTRMAEHQIGRLPVVDESDRLLGIVTLGSLALRAKREDETLKTAKEVSRRSARSA
jgi:CBS domain-containing protein